MARTKKQTTESKPAANKAAEKKAPTKKGESAGPRWSLGLFHGKAGKLSTVYVNAQGEPMPYEQGRVGGQPILFHAVYSGMLYKEARQQLLKDAAAVGIEAPPVEAAEPQVEEESKPTTKRAAAKTTRKRASK